MDFNKPDPSKSDSSSPPESLSEAATLNSTHYRVTSITEKPDIFMDHLEIKMVLSTNIIAKDLLGKRPKVSIQGYADTYFHNSNVWINEQGKIRPEKYHLSTNGRCIYCAEMGIEYSKPRKNKRIGASFNQFSQVEKDSILKLSGSLKTWQWQVGVIAKQLTQLGHEYSIAAHDQLKLKYKPAVLNEYLKAGPVEFYREYEVGFDSHSINDALQNAINQAANTTLGNFVMLAEYGHGRARTWKINNFDGQHFKGVELKSYVKGRYLRLEVKFKSVPESPDHAKESVSDELLRAGALAGRILNRVHSNLSMKPQIIDEHELLEAILNVLTRSRHDRRVQLLIKSLCENLTYAPLAFGTDRTTKHQLTKLVDAGIIEPVEEHYPADAKRRRGLSYRLCKNWNLKGGQ